MRLLSFAALAGLLAPCHALNILITNDDGFGTSNIRELYKAMKAFGHNCYIVASVNDQSGMGGRAVFANSATLTSDSEFGIIKSGAPSIGTDPNDDHIWYYNGSPASQVFVAIDYVLPTHANFSTPDLVLSGPNYGLNLGPFFYSLSGTIGATYAAVERGIPAVAFSAAYGVQTPYYYTNASTKAGLQDPATITARLAANLAQALIDKAKKGGGGGRILPLGYGISVNMPTITSFSDDSCTNPPFVHTRMAGGSAGVDRAAYDAATGLFSLQAVPADGANVCINGDCGLPGEADVLSHGCRSSVSVFTVDYDAPLPGGGGANTPNPRALLPDIVQLANATNLVGGLGANASVAGDPRGTTSAPIPGSTSNSGSSSGSASALRLAGGWSEDGSRLVLYASGLLAFFG